MQEAQEVEGCQREVAAGVERQYEVEGEDEDEACKITLIFSLSLSGR